MEIFENDDVVPIVYDGWPQVTSVETRLDTL